MLREAEAGSPIKAVCAAHNINTSTYHAWDANHDSDTDREAANCLECFFHGMRRVIGKYYGHEQGSGEARPTSAELARELLGPKGEYPTPHRVMTLHPLSLSIVAPEVETTPP